MKTNFYFSTALLFCLVLVILGISIMLGFFPQRHKSNNGSFPKLTTNITNSSKSLTTGHFYKTIIDSSGKYAIVNSSKNIVPLKDKDDKIIWSADVLAPWDTTRIAGNREISAMKQVGDRLWVTIGRHSYVYVDIETGKVTVFGSD